MNAVRGLHTLHQTVLEDAKLTPDGTAHLESPEVPTWIAETSGHDIVGEMVEALGELEDKQREKMAQLFVLICEKGDEISQRRSLELIDLLRSTLTDYCIAQAQVFVEREIG